jgi:hypothetical protein
MRYGPPAVCTATGRSVLTGALVPSTVRVDVPNSVTRELPTTNPLVSPATTCAPGSPGTDA